MQSYKDQIKSPEWQKKRLEVMELHEWKCLCCGNTERELNVHHILYRKDYYIYDYPICNLITLCKDCHESEHEDFYLIGTIMHIVQTISELTNKSYREIFWQCFITDKQINDDFTQKEAIKQNLLKLIRES